MATVVFCEHCRHSNWNKPSIRVTSDPCDFCGGWDAIRKRKVNPRTGKVTVKVEKLKNFEQDARMLPGMPEEAALQRPLDE
jgi:hypothetical protein